MVGCRLPYRVFSWPHIYIFNTYSFWDSTRVLSTTFCQFHLVCWILLIEHFVFMSSTAVHHAIACNVVDQHWRKKLQTRWKGTHCPDYFRWFYICGHTVMHGVSQKVRRIMFRILFQSLLLYWKYSSPLTVCVYIYKTNNHPLSLLRRRRLSVMLEAFWTYHAHIYNLM